MPKAKQPNALLYPIGNGLYLSPQDNLHLLKQSPIKVVRSANPNKPIKRELRARPTLFDHEQGRT